MSPVAVTVELRDRADLAGLELADRPPAPCRGAGAAGRSARPRRLVGVPGVALRVERPGLRTRRYVSRPTNGSAAVLKTRTSSGPFGSGGTSTFAAALVASPSTGALVGGGGEVADDRVEEGPEADAGRRGAHEDRREDRFLDALAEARLELGVGDLLALEVLGQDVVVGLGGRLEELVAATGDLVRELGRDRDLDLLAALATCYALRWTRST